MGGRGGSPNATTQAPSRPASQDPALDAIQQAIKDTRKFNQQLVTLEHARVRMAERGFATREQQDAELVRLARERKILLMGRVYQATMTKGERDAELILGGERKGTVMMA